jgi:pseudaminic acid synthase
VIAVPLEKPFIEISRRRIGSGYPAYIIAELSANHHQQFDGAVKLVKAAKEAGVDAVKLQTYTPDTISIDCRNKYFRIGKGTIWEGRNLYELYSEAYTPWDWQPKLKKIVEEMGMSLFSSPFDKTAVDFLEEMDVPAYKVASFELVDIPLIEYIASKGKPVIMSTGMADLDEISEAVQAARSVGASQVALLKCTSSYPALPGEMNLSTIPDMARRFKVPVGLSDHTLGIAVPVVAVSLGACIIEKHFTLSRSVPGPDSAFSLEPHEFKAMVDAIRTAEEALGEISYKVSKQEAKSRIYRRSLFVVNDIIAGDVFTEENVRSIRPGYGLHPHYLREVMGQRSSCDIKRGTPLNWGFVIGKDHSQDLD